MSGSNFNWFDNLYQPVTGGTEQFGTLASILNIFLPVVYTVVGVLLLISLIVSGLKIMLGNKKGLEESKKLLKNSLIGLVIVALAWVITTIMVNVFGLQPI